MSSIVGGREPHLHRERQRFPGGPHPAVDLAQHVGDGVAGHRVLHLDEPDPPRRGEHPVRRVDVLPRREHPGADVVDDGGHPRHRGAHLVDPEQARLVVDQAPHNAVDAIHTLSLVMAVGPIAAIILALWLIKPADTRT